MAMTVAQAREAAEGAKQTFHELDEGSAGYGSFDLGEMQSSNRKIRELIASYRSGGLEKGTDTGEFIEASILVQADLVEHVRDLFPKWLVEQQTRFDACLVWVATENAYTAALARTGGDVVEQDLANRLKKSASQ